MAISNERKKQRILHHASSVASTMKNGQRKFIPRQKVNGGKVMIEKASGDKFKVYMASDKRFQGMRGKQQYAIEVYDGSKKGVSNSGGVYRQGSDMFKKIRSKLFTYKSGRKSFKEGSTGSSGG